MGMYIHNIATINKQCTYFSRVYFKKTQEEEWDLSLVSHIKNKERIKLN